jgi:excisionase family DNA binding protein
MKTNDVTAADTSKSARRAPPIPPDRLAWPITEGAHRLGIGRSSIYKLHGEGKLRLVKVAGRTLIPDSEIRRLIERGEQ